MLLMCSFHFKLLCNVTPRILTDLTTSIVFPLVVIFSYVPGFFERYSQFLTFLRLDLEHSVVKFTVNSQLKPKLPNVDVT